MALAIPGAGRDSSPRWNREKWQPDSLRLLGPGGE